VILLGILLACGSDEPKRNGPAPPEDAGPVDAGVDAGSDAGHTPFDASLPDTGPKDAGFDAGEEDAGLDAAPDAGFDAGPAGCCDPRDDCECVVGESRACYDGPDGTRGRGVCVDGWQICIPLGGDDVWGPCENERQPSGEQCFGVDLDCNGASDDAAAGCDCALGDVRPCYTGDAATFGVGTCAAGSQTCVDDGGVSRWGPCTGEVAPVNLACDVASCAGGPNPGCQCVNGEVEVCLAGAIVDDECVAGNHTCVGGTWGACLAK
jgi:hypothetical protein